MAGRASALGLVVVRTCIGCGAIENTHECLGTCVDRRLDLIAADEHAAAEAALTALNRALAERRTVVERLAQAAPASPVLLGTATSRTAVSISRSRLTAPYRRSFMAGRSFMAILFSTSSAGGRESGARALANAARELPRGSTPAGRE